MKKFKFSLIDGLLFTAFTGLFCIGLDKFMAVMLGIVSVVLSATGLVVPIWLFTILGIGLTVAFIIVFSFKKEKSGD